MTDFPVAIGGQRLCFTSLCPQSGAGPVLNTNNNTWSIITTAWPAANRAFYIPFIVDAIGFTATQMGIENGATINGNFDVGIYDTSLTKLVSSGSTAHAGASTAQVFNITDTALPPGIYYMAISSDSTTATIRCTGPGAQILRTCGCAQQSTAFVLPATATFAAWGSGFFPFLMVAGYATTV